MNRNVTFYDLTENDKQDEVVAAIDELREAVVATVTMALALSPRQLQ